MGRESYRESLDDDRFPELSIMHGIRDVFLKRPGQPFMVGANESMSYADAYRKTNALAWYFRTECHLAPGSMVVLSVPNLIIAPVIMAAVQLCGACCAMFSYRLTRAEFERNARLVKPDVIIMSEPEACTMAREAVPGALVFAAGCPFAPVPLVEDLVEEAGFDESRVFPDCSEESPIVVFSSGSTGTPKGIVNRASSFALNGRALCASFSITSEDVLFISVPINHVFGIVGLYAVLTAGATFVTCTRFTAETACRLIDDLQATIEFGVSTMFVRELRAVDNGAGSLTSLRAGLVAGAGCPVQLIFDFEERFGCRLMQSYGMSETAATLTVTPLDLPVEVRAHTVGVCIEGSAAKLLPGTDEIACKSASMMLGIMREDGGLELDLDEGGWFHTGDVGKLDDAGMLSIVGRIKDMIIRGGVNIFPAEIESVYEANDEVDQSCVVSCPDDDLGERTCLCVVPKRGSTTSARDFRAWAKGRIEKCKIPDYVVKMDAFPLLGNGKIDKRKLKEQAIATLRDSRAGRAGA